MSLPKKYTQEEMERILQRALSQRAQSGNVSHDQLVEVGRELGLSEQDLMRAIDEEDRVGAFEDAKQEVIRKMRSEWRNHFGSYLGVNAVLLTVNAIQMHGRLTWALATTLGWGIGMTIHTISTFFPKEKDINKAAKKLLRKRDKYKELGE
ncbi:MAG: 2TM domain-containing protein [Candidatus Kapabacteria bacterium]|jgi:hypothetical protein|nr:2TM domain-containing protein [Candidatus Kapabacteria bacterium]